jgi:hypothetical protein
LCFLKEMAPRALVLLAEGAEEMETVITVDILRRGGVEVIFKFSSVKMSYGRLVEKPAVS